MIKKILFTLLATTAIACSTQEKGGIEPCEPMQQDSTYRIATHLFREVNKESSEENLCISPASALWALSMTANGAAGTTAKEMYTAMGYPAAAAGQRAYNSLQLANINAMNNSRNAKVKIANSIWINNKIKVKEEFKNSNALFYNATVKNVTFGKAAENEINNWCKEATDGKIDAIVKDLRPAAQMILVNAICFKANWARPFAKKQTKKAEFRKENGESVETDMMQQTRRAAYYEDETMQATIRPFERNEYSMLLVLPREGCTVEDVAERLIATYNKDFARGKEYMLTLEMPRFKSEFGTSIKPMLMNMGIKTAFTKDADFSGISKTPLRIDDVIQKTYIAVDEEGAEAAAATAVQMVAMSALRPVERKEMILNRPFIYAITDNRSGEILFMGKMGNPNK